MSDLHQIVEDHKLDPVESLFEVEPKRDDSFFWIVIVPVCFAMSSAAMYCISKAGWI